MEHQLIPAIKTDLMDRPLDILAHTGAGKVSSPRMRWSAERRFGHGGEDIDFGYSANAVSRLNEVFLIGVIVCSILTLISLFQVKAADAHGWGFFLRSGFGLFAFFIPAYFLYAGAMCYKHLRGLLDGIEILILRLVGATILYGSIDVLFGAGEVGASIRQSFFNTSYCLEAWVLTIGFFCAGLFLVTEFSFFEIMNFLRSRSSKYLFRRRGCLYPINQRQADGYSNASYELAGEKNDSNLISYHRHFSSPHISDPQSNQLVNCLLQFGIRAVVSAKIPGPVITRFELHLAPGTKSSAICSHHKEIARSLCVQEVRVIEVISGKSCIGIEVPNASREIFSFSELQEELDFSREKIPLLLGRTTTGECKIADLHVMPHLLVAGSTGSGKTMLLHSILMSLTQKFRPSQLKITLIDPKQITFSAWKDLPHLLHPIISDSEEAFNAFKWCIDEMERRYEIIAQKGQVKFPILVVIVDEFADLISSRKSDIENAVKRLAQKARQCDIHLVLATQRPSADVITGHIKTNMPTRISLSVPERRDSRIILDENGAESLLGQGDMLLKLNGQISERLHAPYVSNDEINSRVLNLLSENSDHYFNGDSDSNIKHVDFTKKAVSEKDLFYESVVEFVRETKKASTTALQNQFKIGYQKAAGIMERLEEDQIIGPRVKVNESREVLL